MSNKIEPKSINELLGMNFFIPSYQRGYKWTQQQVKDLLDDIQEFIDKKSDGFYCIQPLVVKKSLSISDENEYKQELENIKSDSDLLYATEKLLSDFTKWEVIDGQQRLTTIYILLSHLSITDRIYTIEYETRQNSKLFLKKIDESNYDDNIDYFHMVKAKEQIDKWFNDKKDEQKNQFTETLLDKVKFIWYESVNENPIKVFTRLNIGKISLTNAELIKALFLNKSNFRDVDYKRIKLEQQEIAGEWDTIENTLQNDEFWLFLNELDYHKPTRIDFIFDLICNQDSLKLLPEEMKDIGIDEYRTFRYFYSWFKRKSNIMECWQIIKFYYQTFQEWFNDLELYHYVGFLIVHKENISEIILEWNKENQTKSTFVSDYLNLKIKNIIAKCSDSDKQYDINGSPKTQCHPILLLHNIQTIINQNKSLIKDDKYKLPVFYKFPFHLFKKEKWDVEHIDSHTENPLENEKVQNEWLRASLIGITENKLREEIKAYLSKKADEKLLFEDLHRKIISSTTDNKLTDNQKDKLWNFTLLDASTNRGYGNGIFPAKRRVIIGKDQGKNISLDDDLNIIESDGAIAFVPQCTKNVFLKYYSPTTNSLREWNKDDAQAYQDNIQTVLKEFLA